MRKPDRMIPMALGTFMGGGACPNHNSNSFYQQPFNLYRVVKILVLFGETVNCSTLNTPPYIIVCEPQEALVLTTTRLGT